MRTKTTLITHQDLEFTIRLWESAVAGGWFWVLRSAEGEYSAKSDRAWITRQSALAMAQAHLERTF